VNFRAVGGVMNNGSQYVVVQAWSQNIDSVCAALHVLYQIFVLQWNTCREFTFLLPPCWTNKNCTTGIKCLGYKEIPVQNQTQDRVPTKERVGHVTNKDHLPLISFYVQYLHFPVNALTHHACQYTRWPACQQFSRAQMCTSEICS